MEKIVSLAKRRGFIFPGSEIYGGLAGTWDYGPLGVLMKDNIKRAWWENIVGMRDEVFGVDAAILMNAKVWEEVLKRDNFTCQNCGWKKGDPQTNNRKFLEVHHRNPVKAKGKPTSANLITLCNFCHDAKKV